MILPDSEVVALKSVLRFWEGFGYISTAVVGLGCIGEFIAEFTSLPTCEQRKHKLAKLSLMILILGIAGELLSAARTSQLSGRIIANIEERAANADQKAGEANDRASANERETAQLRHDNLELLALIQPRELSDEKQKAIGQALRRFSGKSVFLRTYSFDQESMRLSTLLNAALKSGGIDVQFAPTPSPLILPVGINVTGSDKSFVDAIKHALSSEGQLDLTDPKWKPTQVVGGVFVGAYSPKAISADIFVGAKPFSVAATALTVAQQVGEYAAPRSISDKQVKLIRTFVGSALNGHTLTIQANPDEAEIWTFANRIVLSFGMMQAQATLWPHGWIVPAGLKFSIGKNRQKDFDLMVKALDAAGVDKAARLKKQSDHKNVADDDLILTVGPRH